MFDGFCEDVKFDDVFLGIEFLLKNYENIKKEFDFDESINYALILLAKNNRKRFSINKKINHFKALSALKFLLKKGILKLEFSKEKKLVRLKNQRLKKEFRNYVVQDKIIFANNFTRFFFYFLKPNEKLIMAGNLKEVLELIKAKFELYQSFCFEELCREFLEFKFNILGVQSYWDKDLELDIYYMDEKISILGEVKFKKKKICKNILNILKTKAHALKLLPSYYIIISKNGFSKQILQEKDENLLLFSLNDFKEMLDE